MYIYTFLLNICPAYCQVFIVDEGNISQVNVLCDSKQAPNESRLKPSRHCSFSHEVHFWPWHGSFQLLAYVQLAPFPTTGCCFRISCIKLVEGGKHIENHLGEVREP